MPVPESSRCLVDYYRCPPEFVRLEVRSPQSSTPGYFRFGEETTCYGRMAGQAAGAFSRRFAA